MLTRLLIGVVAFYRVALSPLLGRNCRYHPTCSVYMQEALRAHGPARGLWLGSRRILRCHPWASGGYDPVPPPHERRTKSTTPLPL